MFPLAMADVGETYIIENLGFVAGGDVTVISALGNNVIVKVKESRVAISEEMARKIMV